jgi:hypothetical protein
MVTGHAMLINLHLNRYSYCPSEEEDSISKGLNNANIKIIHSVTCCQG